jgi:uncharacterized protein
MLGEPLSSLCFSARGAEGDRALAVADAGGKLGSGKNSSRHRRMEGLFDFRARIREETVEIVFPDGRRFDSRDDALDPALSLVLGQPVTLTGVGPVQHMDDSPVHILTTASLAWLKSRLPDAFIDERRFRPNIVLEVDGEALVEQGWLGRTLIVGEAQFRVKYPTERCVMTTMAQPGLPTDARVLRALAQEADACFGVYAEVVQPGLVRLGDPAS